MSETRTVHLAVYDTMSDWEAAYAVAHINRPLWQREPGRFHVRTVGETSEPVTTAGGVRIVPDLTVDDVQPSDSAMLILVGSDLWANGGHAAFAAQADRFLTAGAPVAAICGATYGLARAGILDRYDHTSNAAAYLALSGYQARRRYRDQPAVTDRNLITASGTAPMDFARHIFVALDLYKPHVLDAWYRLYHDQDASAFAVLAAA